MVEEKQLHEKYQTAKQQVRDLYHLQRYHLSLRHKKVSIGILVIRFLAVNVFSNQKKTHWLTLSCAMYQFVIGNCDFRIR